ncbi:zinc finger and SCAN domain-containing protein 29-like isoform X2 [Mauremys reevesii]|uniref:zinc finger and SCAN domain-containing protein 29-like isoform X2 n=1 Tax=Mauremys reevesii TaxID=260615 RepID=UPI00193F2055|nr:zinc finger and SCAN domain-containing protein 29-like isoform X2 [Mauremys reevesii]
MKSQLRLSHRNFDTYGQISQSLCKKSYDQDTVQCRVKIKEPRQTYHKARETKRLSSAAPKTCQFYKELDAILSGDPTSTTKSPVDTSVGLEMVERGPNPEDEVTDEEVELDDDVELPVGQAARNYSPLRRRLASLSSCSLVSKKQERRHLVNGCGLCSVEMWPSGTPHTTRPSISTR